MPKFRNITDEIRHVDTERGLVTVGPDEVLTLSDAYVASHYIQTGETGEEPLWAPVDETPIKKSPAK